MGDTLTITKLDHSATVWIEQESLRTGQPVEVIAKQLLYRGLEVQRAKPSVAVSHDLDGLAGAWSAEDAEEFRQATAEMNQTINL
jgi:hypothetical protein